MVSQAAWFSAMDMREVLFGFPVHPDSRLYTAFTASCTPYKVLPMGLTISTSIIIQQQLTRLFSDLYMKNLIIYCDHILLLSSGSKQTHLS